MKRPATLLICMLGLFLLATGGVVIIVDSQFGTFKKVELPRHSAKVDVGVYVTESVFLVPLLLRRTSLGAPYSIRMNTEFDTHTRCSHIEVARVEAVFRDANLVVLAQREWFPKHSSRVTDGQQVAGESYIDDFTLVEDLGVPPRTEWIQSEVECRLVNVDGTSERVLLRGKVRRKGTQTYVDTFWNSVASR